MGKKASFLIFFFIYFLLFISFFPTKAFSQYRTEASWSTKVGNPPITSDSLVAGATELAKIIQSNCPEGRVTINNYRCLENKIPKSTNIPYPELVYEQIITSVNVPDGSYCGIGRLQCVGFVRASVAGTTGTPLDKGGDASDFIRNVPTGYEFVRKNGTIKMKPGDIPVWDGKPGHIAITVEVIDDNNFIVAEANYDGCGKVRPDGARQISSPNFAGWLRKI